MSKWILDTNIVSEPNKINPNRNVTNWLAANTIETLFTTVVTVAEINFGINLQTDFAKARQIDEWLNESVRPLYAG